MKSLIFLFILIILGLYFYSLSFFVTLLVLSFLIFFHELGHFLAAKSLKIKVEIFSIGFGKALFEYNFKGTTYRLSALMLGGYVKLKEQDDLNPHKEVFEKDSYSLLSPLKKIYILLAGPLFNIILAFILYLIIAFMGVSKILPIVGEIQENSAAFEAGMQKGDIIKSINGVAISSFDELRTQVKDQILHIRIQRQENILELTLIPKLGLSYNDFLQKVEKPLIGISASGERGIFYYRGLESLKYAYEESLQASTLIIKGLIKLIVGELEPQNLGGIITMVDFTSKASQTSLVTLFLITALISINLGIVNLLPIPMLDGGHISFNLYELIFRRKIQAKVFEYLSYVGAALLLSLMLYTTYNDIIRFSTLK